MLFRIIIIIIVIHILWLLLYHVIYLTLWGRGCRRDDRTLRRVRFAQIGTGVVARYRPQVVVGHQRVVVIVVVVVLDGPNREWQLRHFPHERPNLLEVGVVGYTSTRTPHTTQALVQTQAQRGSIRFMFLQMSVQVRLLAKAPFTQGAFKRPFLIVNISHVSLQVARYAKGSFAVLALVRLLSSVCPQVAR